MVMSKSGVSAGLLIKANPWFRYGMSQKSHYLANPPPWAGNPSALSSAQRQVNEAFGAAASAAAQEHKADGTMATSIKRVKAIGRALRGRTYADAASLQARLPKYPASNHPLVLRLRGLGGK